MDKVSLEANLRDRFAGLLVAQGVLTALFGIVVLVWPGLSVNLFVSLFGVMVLAWGLVSLVHSFLGVGRSSLWWLGSILACLRLDLACIYYATQE